MIGYENKEYEIKFLCYLTRKYFFVREEILIKLLPNKSIKKKKETLSMQEKRVNSILFFLLLSLIVCSNTKTLENNKPRNTISLSSPYSFEEYQVQAKEDRIRERILLEQEEIRERICMEQEKVTQNLEEKIENLLETNTQRSKTNEKLKQTLSQLKQTLSQKTQTLSQKTQNLDDSLQINEELSKKNEELSKENKELNRQFFKRIQELKDVLQYNSEHKAGLSEMRRKQQRLSLEKNEQENQFLSHTWDIVIAKTTDYLLSYLTKKKEREKNKYFELLGQSVEDTKELKILSLFPVILGGTPYRIINGYNKTSNIPKENIINFIGETMNAFGLRYFQEPIANKSKFITNRLKDSNNPIVKAVLKSRCLYLVRLTIIRSFWCLEKFTINQVFS